MGICGGDLCLALAVAVVQLQVTVEVQLVKVPVQLVQQALVVRLGLVGPVGKVLRP